MSNQMAWGVYDMSESSDEKRMTAVDWKSAIEIIAAPYGASDTRESYLARAARRAGITYRQAKALFYGEMADPKYSVALRVQEAAEKARREAKDLATRFETIAGALHATDSDFYSPEIAEIVGAARALRGLDRAGIEGKGVRECTTLQNEHRLSARAKSKTD